MYIHVLPLHYRYMHMYIQGFSRNFSKEGESIINMLTWMWPARVFVNMLHTKFEGGGEDGHEGGRSPWPYVEKIPVLLRVAV